MDTGFFVLSFFLSFFFFFFFFFLCYSNLSVSSNFFFHDF